MKPPANGSDGDRGGQARRAARRARREPLGRQQAWDYLLNVLSRQAYTVAELKRKLARRQVPEALADELVARLIELRLVDDKVYAEQYVSARKTARGRLALRAELRRKGVAEEIVDERVERLGDDQQLKAAVELLHKHAWRYRPEEAAGLGEAGQEEIELGEAGAGAARWAADRQEAAGHDAPEPQPLSHEEEREARQRLRRAEARAKAFLARRGFAPDVVVAAVERVGWFGS